MRTTSGIPSTASPVAASPAPSAPLLWVHPSRANHHLHGSYPGDSGAVVDVADTGAAVAADTDYFDAAAAVDVAVVGAAAADTAAVDAAAVAVAVVGAVINAAAVAVAVAVAVVVSIPCLHFDE